MVFPIVQEIKQNTGIDCWIDIEGIESGDQFQNVIIDAIDNSDIIILMLSKNFIAPYVDETTGEVDLKKQTFPEKEVMYALRHGKRLVPISIDGTSVYDCKWLEFNCSGLDSLKWYIEDEKKKLFRNLLFWNNASEGSSKKTVINVLPEKEKHCRLISIRNYLFILITWLSAILIETIFIFLFFYSGPRASTWNARFLCNSYNFISKDSFFTPSIISFFTVIYFYFIMSEKRLPSFKSWLRIMANAVSLVIVLYIITHLFFIGTYEFYIKGVIYIILTIIFYFIYSIILKSNSSFSRNIPF